jgi:hypothetical protein
LQRQERQQPDQRQEIFKTDDEIMDKREALIESLERRLTRQTTTQALFTIQWTVA